MHLRTWSATVRIASSSSCVRSAAVAGTVSRLGTLPVRAHLGEPHAGPAGTAPHGMGDGGVVRDGDGLEERHRPDGLRLLAVDPPGQRVGVRLLGLLRLLVEGLGRVPQRAQVRGELGGLAWSG
ncbi:hypothetical protein ACIRJM_48260 [Streptomyces sp. NPDC102405]|uniref:hypothetical protein n=1 Tax=Streptomyces sp. NPDC102405 TaxID=3366170 RepID=UPI0038102D36